MDILLINTVISRRKSLAALHTSSKLRIYCGNPFSFCKIIIQKMGTSFLNVSLSHSMKELIDRFFELNQNIWKIGVVETSFDFLRNCGILPNGESFFIDLGDFSTDYNKFCEILKEERWKYRLDYLSLSTKERNYYDNLAFKYFTIQNFRLLWKSEI